MWLLLPSAAAIELRALVAIPATDPCTDLGNVFRTASVLPIEWPPRSVLTLPILTIGTLLMPVPPIEPNMCVRELIVARALFSPSTVVGSRVPILMSTDPGNRPEIPVLSMLGTDPSRLAILRVEIRNNDPLVRPLVTVRTARVSIYLPVLDMLTLSALR